MAVGYIIFVINYNYSTNYLYIAVLRERLSCYRIIGELMNGEEKMQYFPTINQMITCEKEYKEKEHDIFIADADDVIKKIYFEICSDCNLSCTMCFRHTWIDETTGMLKLDAFMDVLNDAEAMEYVHTVFLGGMGEPLMHPDIETMIRAAHEKGKNVELITNCTMLTESMSERLISAGLNKIWVSMDGFSKDIYESIRINGKFGKIVEHIEAFNRVNEKLGANAKVGITFVAQKSNIQQLEALPDFVEKYNISDINISNVIPNTENAEDEILYAKVITNYFSPLRGDITDYLKYDIPAMDLTKPGVEEAYEAVKPILNKSKIPEGRNTRDVPYCRFVNEGHVFVRWDGNIAPCMGILHSSYTYFLSEKRAVYHHSFGNIYEQKLSEIWNSQEYSNFRQRVINFDFSPCVVCGGCDMREMNEEDCYGNTSPTCGACLWAHNIASCP